MSEHPNPLNILLAEGNSSTAKILSQILKLDGHLVDLVHDGQEALDRLKQTSCQYQLLIISHKMQSMNGLEFVEELRISDFEVIILVMSGMLTNDLETAYRKHGVRHFIKKPFSVSDLRKTLALIV